MKWLPRTLFGRNLLLIASLILFTELALAFAAVRWIAVPKMGPSIDIARQHADAIATALAALPPPQQEAYRKAIDGAGPTRIAGGAGPAPAFDSPRRPAVAAFIRQLRTRIPSTYLVGWQEAPQILWINPPVENGPRYWIGFPSADFFPRLQGLAAAELGGAALLALIGALVVQRRIDRPLRELGAAAAAVGAGRAAPTLREDGPTETAQLARAFNLMARNLQSLDRERALMLAGISHDLRTPLAKIRLALELIGPAAEAGLRDSIERSVDSANRVIDQFVDFARVGEDEPLAPGRLDEIVRAVAAEMTTTASPIAVDLPSCPLEAPLRPLAIRRLLANLVDNAQKHAPGPIRIAAGVEGGDAVLSVIDTGPGIPAAEAERLKRPFVRLDEARGGVPGAGLGLAIVDRIVGSHRGRFELHSGRGAPPRPGLEARVVLPLA